MRNAFRDPRSWIVALLLASTPSAVRAGMAQESLPMARLFVIPAGNRAPEGGGSGPAAPRSGEVAGPRIDVACGDPVTLRARDTHWAAFEVAPERTLWAAFQRHEVDAEGFSWLCLDLDGDGICGEPGERLRSDRHLSGRPSDRWYVGDLPSDDPQRPHTDFAVEHFGWTFRWRLRWYGGPWLEGEGAAGIEDAFLAHDPAQAPHFDLHMGGGVPHWVPTKVEALEPGRTQRIAVGLGSSGRGRLASSTFDVARIPGGTSPTARVRYTDLEGVEREVAVDLGWWCCGTTREGLLDVPSDLDPERPVSVRVSLPAGGSLRMVEEDLAWPTRPARDADVPGN